jgi:hypothetical protein
MPQPDPEATPTAETDADREIDVEIAPEADDDTDAPTDAFDGSESHAPTDDEIETDEPELETDAADSEDDADPDTGLSELDDEVDLRAPPVGVASEAMPRLGDTGVYEERWKAIQTAFVDEPRHSVQNADGLIAEAMEDLARSIASHRDALQSQWRQDADVDTEHLRLTFQEYRTFLHGLLSA